MAATMDRPAWCDTKTFVLLFLHKVCSAVSIASQGLRDSASYLCRHPYASRTSDFDGNRKIEPILLNVKMASESCPWAVVPIPGTRECAASELLGLRDLLLELLKTLARQSRQ